MIKYLGEYNKMVYWVEDDVVMCDDLDGTTPLESAYTLEDFLGAIAVGLGFKEIK